jgi:quinol monooxygenase YgiN
MLIVAGVFEVDPERRDEFLRAKEDVMRTSRQEPGCHAYAFSADPLEPGRVLLYERWEDKPSLAAHLARLRAQPAPEAAPVPVLSSEVAQYEVSAAGTVGS